jgi:hypothetical protein
MPPSHDAPLVQKRPQDRLVRIAQRLKRERNQARIERDEALLRCEEARRARDRARLERDEAWGKGDRGSGLAVPTGLAS